MAVSKDKSIAVIDFVQVHSRACQRSLRLLLKALQADFYSELIILERKE